MWLCKELCQLALKNKTLLQARGRRAYFQFPNQKKKRKKKKKKDDLQENQTRGRSTELRGEERSDDGWSDGSVRSEREGEKLLLRACGTRLTGGSSGATDKMDERDEER